VPRVLTTVDVGTGSGTWPIEVATRYPSATVFGIDISPIQYLYEVPENVEFEVLNVLEGGLERFHDSSVDLVHSR
jgi:tRNA G46 methylase TrmB